MRPLALSFTPLIITLTVVSIGGQPGRMTSAAEPNRPADETFAKESDEFTDWREVTNGLRRVGSKELLRLSMGLCRAEPLSDEEIVKILGPTFGDHLLRYTRVYANVTAWQTLDGARPWRFAPGSVLVKQKLEKKDTRSVAGATTGSATTGSGTAADGVGVMIKREAGYAPDDGDWQYLYFEGHEKPVTSLVAAKHMRSLDNCAACHRTAGAQDHVYLPFLTKHQKRAAE